MATDVLIDAATNAPVQTEAPAEPASPDARVSEAPEESPYDARIRELTEQVEGLRALTQAQQARPPFVVQGGPAFQPKPEYEQHDYTRYLDSRYSQPFQVMNQTIQQNNLALVNQNDLLNARLNIDDTFGGGTWRKYGRQVEDAFQATVAQGAPEARERIFYRLATEKNWKLVPLDERDERDTRQRRRSGAQLASIGNQPPARRADQPKPEKPVSAMTKDERDAAFQSYIQQNGGF